jgi:hypothetical protein
MVDAHRAGGTVVEGDLNGWSAMIYRWWTASAMILNSYDNFVDRLANICMPDSRSGVFQTFSGFLESAYRQLEVSYWNTMKNPNLSQKERKLQCHLYIEQLEAHPDMGKFYREFSACLNVALFKKMTGSEKLE